MEQSQDQASPDGLLHVTACAGVVCYVSASGCGKTLWSWKMSIIVVVIYKL